MPSLKDIKAVLNREVEPETVWRIRVWILIVGLVILVIVLVVKLVLAALG